MKHFILAFIALVNLSLRCTAQDISVDRILRESVIIETDIFKVNYSEVLEQPLWVEYTVLCPKPGVDRNGLDFYEEADVHTSDDDDYYANEWDKGHMAPAAAFNCDREMLKKTFTYLNSALQHESLNRGVWNHLERFERNLGNFYTVQVRVDVIFSDNPRKLPTGASIPSSFKKTIKWGDKVAVFEFPNQDTSGTDWTDYLIE